MDEHFCWIGIGGNVGNLAQVFQSARTEIQALSAHPIKASPIFQSEPWGLKDQAPFLNQVVGLRPKTDPGQLYRELVKIERRHGRHRPTEVRWGPRRLDLDILSWPGFSGTLDSLILPHPRLHLRQFVLKPWSMIAPDLVPFGHQQTVEELLKTCPDTGAISLTSLPFWA